MVQLSRAEIVTAGDHKEAIQERCLSIATSSFDTGITNDFELYEQLLDFLKSQSNICFVDLGSINQINETSNLNVAFRHDIDADIVTAVKCGQALNQRGLPGSFFPLHTSHYYWVQPTKRNETQLVRHKGVIPYLLDLQESGCEVGLHNDALGLIINHGVDGYEILKHEIDWLRGLGLPLTSTVAHNSAAVYGAECFEIFTGKAAGNRNELHFNDLQIDLQKLSENELGLVYEGNHPVPRPSVEAEKIQQLGQIEGNALHTPSWQKLYFLDHPVFERGYDYDIWVVGKDLWLLAGAGQVQYPLSFDALCKAITDLPAGSRIVFTLHPIYFSAPEKTILTENHSISDTSQSGFADIEETIKTHPVDVLTNTMSPIKNLTQNANLQNAETLTSHHQSPAPHTSEKFLELDSLSLNIQIDTDKKVFVVLEDVRHAALSLLNLPETSPIHQLQPEQSSMWAERWETFNNIEKAVWRAATITNALLDYAKQQDLDVINTSTSHWPAELEDDDKAHIECLIYDVQVRADFYKASRRRFKPSSYGEFWKTYDGGIDWYQWMYKGRLKAHEDCLKTIESLQTNEKVTLSVMDIGCGMGVGYAEALKEQSYVGVDLSLQNIDWCLSNRSNPKHVYLHKDILNPVQMDELFYYYPDFVFSQGTLDNSWDILAYLKAMKKITQKWIYLTLYRGWFPELANHRYNWQPDTHAFYNDLSPDLLKAQLHDMGFSYVEITPLEMSNPDPQPPFETRILASL